MNKWNGKTKGSLLGYRFFVFIIQKLGISFAYLFSYFVALYYVLCAKEQRNGLVQFYRIGFRFSKTKSLLFSYKNFVKFAETLIDRVAVVSKRKKEYTYVFNNEKALKQIVEKNKGGILFSGHLGNWESAGNLIYERVTSKINVLMLDAEVEKIKTFMQSTTGGHSFNLIPLKDDLSHLILIYRALKNNELVAIHADRVTEEGKFITLKFLNSEAKFPLGPFILAEKFKVPVTFVFAIKEGKRHYALYATTPIDHKMTAEEIAKKYVLKLEEMVKKHPEQWFNFYKYYADK